MADTFYAQNAANVWGFQFQRQRDAVYTLSDVAKFSANFYRNCTQFHGRRFATIKQTIHFHCFHLVCYVRISAVVSGKSTTANESCELSNEVLELRSELAKSNDKIAEMDRKFAQLNATVSGRPKTFYSQIYQHRRQRNTVRIF